MFLFELWGINIDYKLILSFLIGIVLGFILALLIYAILVLSSLGSKKFRVKTELDDLTLQEVKDLVNKAHHEYKDNNLRGDTPKFSHCLAICKDLAYVIASRYYPNSKYPLLELSVDEAVSLMGYIKERLNDILDRRGLKLFKKFKISTIFDLSIKSSKVVQSKAYEVGKNVSKGVSTAKKIINIINPAWWIRKGTTDIIINIVLNKLYLILITIVGEETYKIYSKKFLKETQDGAFDDDINKIVDSINEDLDEVKENILEDTKDIKPSTNVGKMKQKIVVSNKIKNNDYKSIFDKRKRLKE